MDDNTKKKIDAILTKIRKDYEKQSHDEEYDDDLHDDDKTGSDFFEAAHEVLDQVRKELGIPETDTSRYREKIPTGEIGIWTQHKNAKNPFDNDLYFDVAVFEHYQTSLDYYGASFWAPTIADAEKVIAEEIVEDDVDPVVISLKQLGTDKDGNPYGSVILSMAQG
jgi:hypothetical protein